MTGGTRTVRMLRREGLGQDALLFSAAFSLGALLYLAVEVVRSSVDGGADVDFWSVTTSEQLVLVGLIVAELFVVANNGLRQGIRGHSIGKHRVGLAVVDVTTGQPSGAARGLLRGLVTAVLIDLSAAAIPAGFPTVLRRLTPEAWHVGGAAYVALLLLIVPLLLSSDRSVADRISRTHVVLGTGPGATTTERRSRQVGAIEAAGAIGLLAVAITYIAFFAQLLRFPDLF
jgi:hypothetical protein